MYKVFKNERELFFGKPQELSKFKGEILVENADYFDKEVNIEDVISKGADKKMFITEKPKKLLENLFKNYKKIYAAGGLVLNDKNRILMIKRLGKWDLPKGKIETNEAKEIAAVREVEEECGIYEPVIEKHLINTHHTYKMNKKPVLKTTHWYLMRYTGNEDLIPQTEENITKVKWVKPKKLKKYLRNTYGSIIDVVEAYKTLKKSK